MVTVHIGQDAVLPCEVEDDSSPAVMWKKDGFPIHQDNKKYVPRFPADICNCVLQPLSNTGAVYPFIHLLRVAGTPYYQRALCIYMQLS